MPMTKEQKRKYERENIRFLRKSESASPAREKKPLEITSTALSAWKSTTSMKEGTNRTLPKSNARHGTKQDVRSITSTKNKVCA